MVGQRIGGINVFGGGLALYIGGVRVGGLGVSGDTSCTDHMVAWRTRNSLRLDGFSANGGQAFRGDPAHPDNIIFDIKPNPATAAPGIRARPDSDIRPASTIRILRCLPAVRRTDSTSSGLGDGMERRIASCRREPRPSGSRCLGRSESPSLGLGSCGDGESRLMIGRQIEMHSTAVGESAPPAVLLSLRRWTLALCLASGAKADALSAGKRAFARHDYVRAASLLLVEAERGSPVAQTYLGYMYQYGLGVPRDYVLAASWLHQAAEQGEPTGQFLLGLLFDKGYGVPQDWVEAEVWLNLAAAHAGARQQEYFARVRDCGRPEADAQSARRNAAARVCLDADRQPELGGAFGEVLRPLAVGLRSARCSGASPRLGGGRPVLAGRLTRVDRRGRARTPLCDSARDQAFSMA